MPYYTQSIAIASNDTFGNFPLASFLYLWYRRGQEVAMRLEEWIEKEGITQKAFAEKIGVTEGFVSHLIKGRRTPSAALIQKIEGATKFEVLFWDLLPPKTKDDTREEVAA